MSRTPDHEYFMRRALVLAKKGAGSVLPNPMVGAVLVKNGKIIAGGFHKRYGGDHAEVQTLKNVTRSQIRGATLYVTLEPCNHFGKTPPCTNFLISKGVKDIVIAMRDPNPLVAGKGISALKKAGVKVRVGVLKAEAKKLNTVFFHHIQMHMPWVALKFGLTLDGKIATLDRESKYITGKMSRKAVHALRSRVQAVVTTSETVLSDNPHLGVRLTSGKDPLRVVLDTKLRTSTDADVYRDGNVFVAATSRSSSGRRKIFENRGIRVVYYKGDRIPLKRLFRDLYLEGVCHVMVEGGSELATSLLRECLVNEVFLFYAPKILGAGIPWVRDLGIKNLRKALRIENITVKRLEEDVLIQGTVVR